MHETFLGGYFGFNRQQRNGLVVLMIVSLVLLVVRVAYPHFITPDKIIIRNLPLLELKIDSAAAQTKSYYHKESRPGVASTLFVFDPNNVTLEQLLKLGFYEKTAKRFLKFRSKGFVFKQKEDLQKVYGISGGFYAKLEPYILIEEKGKISSSSNTTRTEKPLAQNKQQAKLELNTADSAALVALRGIGPSYAKRILKYRSILGGYVALEQLKEVYGLTEETYAQVSPLFTVDASLIKKINVNTDDFKTVNRHPYLSYELTKAIFNQRRKAALTPVSLKEVLNDEALCNKVLPYLTF